MNRHQKPELPCNRAAKIVCAIAAAALTWLQFSSVVSLADQPPMAIAGYRSGGTVAQSAQHQQYALVKPAAQAR